MSQMQLQPDDSIGPLDWLKAIPFEPAAWSDRLGWVGMEAVCCRTEPAFELDQPALTHHWLALFVRPPQELDLRYEGVRRHGPPPVGSIMLVPAGSPAGWRWSGRRDLLSIYLAGCLNNGSRRIPTDTLDVDLVNDPVVTRRKAISSEKSEGK